MELAPGDSFWSCDGRFFLTLQSDNNLVLYQVGASALWSSNTVGTGATTAVFQDDGNFVLYTAAGAPVWSTVTTPGCGAKLAVQTDGNLVVYDAASAPLWSSGSCCH
jgi:hypothetical protein